MWPYLLSYMYNGVDMACCHIPAKRRAAFLPPRKCYFDLEALLVEQQFLVTLDVPPDQNNIYEVVEKRLVASLVYDNMPCLLHCTYTI